MRFIATLLLLAAITQNAEALNVVEEGGVNQLKCHGKLNSLYAYEDSNTNFLYISLQVSRNKEGLVSGNSEVRFHKTDKINIGQWRQVTNYFPGIGDYRVIETAKPATLNIDRLTSADRDIPVATILFSVRRAFAGAGELFTLEPAQYVTQNPLKVFNIKSKSVNVSLASIEQENTCVKVYPRWCGDGIVSNGEQCDGIAGTAASQSCSSQCKLIEIR